MASAAAEFGYRWEMLSEAEFTTATQLLGAGQHAGAVTHVTDRLRQPTKDTPTEVSTASAEGLREEMVD